MTDQERAKAISEVWNDAACAWNNAAVDQKLYNKLIPLIELLRPVAEGKSVIIGKDIADKAIEHLNLSRLTMNEIEVYDNDNAEFTQIKMDFLRIGRKLHYELRSACYPETASLSEPVAASKEGE